MIRDEDLLVAFANLGHEGPDELADPGSLRTWAAGIGLQLPTADAGAAADLDLLRAIRRSLQGLLLTHNGVEDVPDLRSLESVPLRLTFADGPGVGAARPTTVAAVVAGEVASALVRSAARPGWRRLKACPGPGCGFVFRDTTRNGSRRWCLMSACGNRAKGAAFRARAPRRG